MVSRLVSLLALTGVLSLVAGDAPPAAAAQTPRLGIAGAKFTIDGQPRFLILVSYFDALDTPDVDRDFEYLASRVDGVRIFATWWNFGPGHCPLRFSPRTVIGVDEDGKAIARPEALAHLQSVLDSARKHGLIVDLSFAADTIEGLSTLKAGPDGGVCKPSGAPARVRWAEYANGIAAVTAALRSPRFDHVFFDLQNEWGHPVNGATEADLQQVVKAARGADPDRILTISSFEPDAAKHVGYVERLGLSAVNFHDFPRGRGWGSRTATQVSQFREALLARGLTMPVYAGEPDPSGYGEGLKEFETSIKGAKRAGAAAWTFHTRAGHELESRGLVDALDPDARRFLDEARSLVEPPR
jgi:hypothetical protein